MINLEKKTSQPVEAEMHYKMYKDGKKLVTAGITTLMFSGFVLGTQTTAHADTTSDTSSDGGQAQATTGGNAVTQTTAASAASATTATTQTAAAAASTATASQAGTITQPVNVDSSALDQAVDAAKQAGLKVTPQPTTSSTVAPSEVDSAKAQIESDYASQAAKLNEATEQQETVNHYNDSKGDTTALDEAVKKAQSTPGMSVKQDETTTTTKRADDKSGIANWEKSTASDYASQVDAINKAIDAQNQNNAKYEQEMAEWRAAHLNNNPNGLTTADVQQQLTLAAEPDAKVDIKILDSRATLTASDRVFWDTTWNRVNLSTAISGNIAQATYTNLKNSYYVDKNGQKHLIAKIVKVFSNTDDVASKSDTSIPFLDIGTDPSRGVWYDGTSGVTETDTFYDADGNVINLSDNTAHIAVTSLNSYYESPKNGYTNGNFALSGLPLHVESATPISNGKAYTLAGSSVTAHSNGALYADQTNNVAYQGGPTSDQTTWKSDENWEEIAKYYGSGIIAVHGDSFSIRFATNFGDNDTNYYSGIWYTLDTIIPQTPTPTRETSTTSYHYNVLKVNPNWSADDLSYQYHNLNVTTTPDKNWTQGDQVVTGKTEIAGDVATATISMNYAKPSDSKESMSKLSVTDNYSQMVQYVTYQGAQVYENDQLATDQYNIVNDAKTGTVTATRKDASKAPGGSIKLVVDFKINENTPSGTKLINGGSATINNETATTPEVPVNTYDQTANKHWIEGSQVVDGKTYINDDVITTKVDMSLPDPSTLAHSLTNVTIDDNYTDFANKAKLQSYRVEENGNDVTDQYTVTNKDGHLTAVRKDASTAPAGTVSLIATWLINSDVASGTTFTNAGSGRINNHTVDTNTPIVKTYEQTANKHWVEGSQTVDDKTYINGDTIHARVEMSLPNKSDLAKPLTDVTLVDDYSEFQKNVTYQSAQVIENGKDATSQYTITNVGGKITAMRKTPGDAPAGNVQLLVNFKINDGVASGTTFTNRGSGRINNHTVNTNNAKVVTYVQSTDKHWVEGTQTVDGKTYVDGDTVNAEISSNLPDPSTLAKKLTGIKITDDYTNFMSHVEVESVKVKENDKDVSTEYDITIKDGKIVATRKDASKAPGGTVKLDVTFKVKDDVASGTVFQNSGAVMINDSTVETPKPTVVTYKQTSDKHWTEGSQDVDGKVYVSGDEAQADVSMSLPDPSALAKALTKVEVVDDYSSFADKVDYKDAKVYENGVDATSEYTIVNKDGKVTATRKDASKAPKGTVDLHVTWTIHSDVENGTELTNNGSGTINNETVKTPSRKVTVYTQDADKHWVEGDQTVDNKTYVDGDEAHGRVTMNLPDPSTLAKPLSDVTLVDDYTDFMDKVTYESAQVIENGKDMTAEYIITNVNGKVTAMRKDPSSAPAGNAQLLVNFKINDDVKSGTVLTNKGSGRINNKTVSTNEAKITVYTQDADKHWTEGSQTVDGEVFVDGAITHATVTTTLPDQSTLAKPLTDITITDDYSQFADKVDLQDVHVLENDKDVTDQYTITKQDGKVVATRKDASKAPAGKAQLVLTFKLHTDVESGTKLINKGSSMINKHTVSTNDATITTFKPNPKKDIVVSVDNTKSLNGSNIDLNSTFDYKLEGATLPMNSNALSEYGFHDDYDQTHDQYNGGYVVLLNNDVTLTDGTVLKKGTDVTKYTTQTIDQENGKVDIEFDSDFLAKVDRTKSEFGATAYLAMTRIKAGDVENKYTNTINGTEFTSNTVTSHTDEPKPTTPETPSTPKTETPTTPQSTTPETPIKTSQQPVFAAVQPATVAAERQATPQQALPQTGNDKDEALALTGLASLLFGLGTLGLKKRRRRA